MLPSPKKDCIPTTPKGCVVYEFSCQCEARYVGALLAERLAEGIKQHVHTNLKKKSYSAREQPPRLCKNSKSKINFELAIRQHLIANPECATTYTYENFWDHWESKIVFSFKCFEICLHQDSKPSLV